MGFAQIYNRELLAGERENRLLRICPPKDQGLGLLPQRVAGPNHNLGAGFKFFALSPR